MATGPHRTRNVVSSPVAASHSTSTFVTYAPGGPCRTAVSSSSSAGRAPSAINSTVVPSETLRTHPKSPSRWAWLLVKCRKNTPWTRPWTSARRRACSTPAPRQPYSALPPEPHTPSGLPSAYCRGAALAMARRWPFIPCHLSRRAQWYNHRRWNFSKPRGVYTYRTGYTYHTTKGEGSEQDKRSCTRTWIGGTDGGRPCVRGRRDARPGRSRTSIRLSAGPGPGPAPAVRLGRRNHLARYLRKPPRPPGQLDLRGSSLLSDRYTACESRRGRL